MGRLLLGRVALALVLVVLGTGACAPPRRAEPAMSCWSTEVVDQESYVGRYASLQFDPAGRPHIGYWDVGNHTLKYAWNLGDAWRNVTVVAAGRESFTSLALGSDSLPHIGYYDETQTPNVSGPLSGCPRRSRGR